MLENGIVQYNRNARVSEGTNPLLCTPKCSSDHCESILISQFFLRLVVGFSKTLGFFQVSDVKSNFSHSEILVLKTKVVFRVSASKCVERCMALLFCGEDVFFEIFTYEVLSSDFSNKLVFENHFFRI